MGCIQSAKDSTQTWIESVFLSKEAAWSLQRRRIVSAVGDRCDKMDMDAKNAYDRSTRNMHGWQGEIDKLRAEFKTRPPQASDKDRLRRLVELHKQASIHCTSALDWKAQSEHWRNGIEYSVTQQALVIEETQIKKVADRAELSLKTERAIDLRDDASDTLKGLNENMALTQRSLADGTALTIDLKDEIDNTVNEMMKDAYGSSSLSRDIETELAMAAYVPELKNVRMTVTHTRPSAPPLAIMKPSPPSLSSKRPDNNPPPSAPMATVSKLYRGVPATATTRLVTTL